LESADKIVLIIRGDLLKKYPNTEIYAAKGEWKGGKRVPIFKEVETDEPAADGDGETCKSPIFRGTLAPDITFLGFDLTEEEVRGSPKEGDHKPGWFFVIEERVSETRFGLDADGTGTPPSNWDQLAWGHFTLPASMYINDQPAPDLTVTVDLDGTAIDVKWDTHAGMRAWITLQKPVRIAVHGDDMLPEKEAEGGS
jgi:hypothetical protein